MRLVSTKRTVFRTCPLCEATCGLALELDLAADRAAGSNHAGTNGHADPGPHIAAVRGDPDDIFSRGFICPKGASLGELERDPDRVRRPLVKSGGDFREVSWEDAFARINDALVPIRQKHGKHALALYVGNPNVHNIDLALYNRALVKAAGTRNYFTASSVDQLPKHLAAALMYGDPLAVAVPDIDHSDLVVILGANPMVSNGSLWTAPNLPGRLRALKARGGRIIVVDPKRTRTADIADRHLPIRPGYDAHLLLSVIHVLFARGWVDPAHLAGELSGDVADVKALVRDFAPARIAPLCGLDSADIEDLAAAIAKAERAAIYGRLGTSAQRFGTVTSWLVDLLNLLTGNLDRQGGAMFPTTAHSPHRPGKPPGGRGFATGRWHSRIGNLPEVMGELPVAILADEIETPGDEQVRALITVGGNPVLSTPDAGRLDRALGSLEFMVSVDPYINETTRHADVILPPPPLFTHGHYDLVFYRFAVRDVANYSPALRPLVDGELREWHIMLRLSTILMGQGPKVPFEVADNFVINTVIQREIGDRYSPLAGRPASELLAALAPRIGAERIVDFLLRAGPYGDHFGANPDGITLDKLEEMPHGIDLGPLKPSLPRRLLTENGKIDIAPAAIVADLDRLRAEMTAQMAAESAAESATESAAEPATDTGAPTTGASTGTEDTLLLIGRRTLRSNNSWMHNVKKLVAGKPRCTVQMHPDDAGSRQLSDGDTAEVRSAAGAITLPVELTDAIRPGVVSIPHGWGHGVAGTRMNVAQAHAGANVNVLTPSDMDPLSGNAILNGITVTVSPYSDK